MNKSYFVYILLTERNTYYCGYTDDVLKRFQKHLDGKAAKYTKANKPIKIVYQKEFSSKNDAMKEEIVNICRTKRDSGKDAFKLPAHKDADTGASEATMHDDRAYVLAMLGWYLSERRIEHIKNKKKDIGDLDQMFEIKRPKAAHSYFG